MSSICKVMVFALALAGCEACGHDGETAGGSPGGGETTGGGEEGTSGQGTGGPGGPAPHLVVRLEREGSSRDVAFVVENHDRADVSLRAQVLVERRRGESWEAVDEIQSVSLRMDCATAPPECMPLAPGAALHPPPWSGMIGDAQCACERCVDAPAGDYRVVVTTCDGAHRVASDPVTL